MQLFPHSRQRQGVALVIVMAFLILVTTLIVSFFASVSSELSGAKSYASEATTKQLADSAVQMVMGNIKLAVSGSSGASTVAWASQPGMIRTYDSSGHALAYYKLYSSNNMVVTQPATFTVSDDLKATSGNRVTDWASQPALFTDLNAPVVTASGTSFPILDPRANGVVPGFGIGNGSDSPVVAGAGVNPAPMPVKWIYVLRDGSLTTPTSIDASGKVATWSGTDAPTASNPITGRIAFWTDDESCKVNINTASVGTFWDVPRAYSVLGISGAPTQTAGTPTAGSLTQEQALGYYQPVQKEFQRYPGHPAMTDLRAVFGTALTTDQIYNIVPRVTGGGSNLGTVSVSSSTQLQGYPKSERLYSTVDELLLKADRTMNSGLSVALMEETKFFLTANSRAPETNLFNLPRVACWPIHADLATNASSPYTTAFDRLIALCASTGTSGKAAPYYFQRENALNTTHDISLTRNQQLYSYLQYLTNQPTPGFGVSTFAQKYGNDRDQILTEIFDYIRALNLYDTTLSGTGQYAYTATSKGCVVPTVNGSNAGLGRYFTLSKLALAFICNADATVPASCITSGSTANQVLGGVALTGSDKYIQAICIPGFFSPMCGFIALTPNMKVKIEGLSSLKINDQFIFPTESDNNAEGAVVPYNTNYPNVPQLATNTGNTKYGGDPGWRYFTVGTTTANNRTLRALPKRGNLPADASVTAGIAEPYPFVGTPIKITDTGSMTFNGGTVKVTILDPSGNQVQQFTIKWPGGTFPVPKLVTQGTPLIGNNAGTSTTQENWWAFHAGGIYANHTKPGRLGNLGLSPGTPSSPLAGALLRTEDVIETMVVPHGDYRIIACQPAPSDTLFQPHRYYGQSSNHLASNLGNSSSTSCDVGYDGGQYFTNASVLFPSGHMPDISATTTQTPESTGDFDDPLPDFFPGPFANKPDEGAAQDPKKTGANVSIPYYYSVSQTSSASSGVDEQPDGGAFFSPNRMMPSPGMFGSLPTGVCSGTPWQTLLFRPQSGHPGMAAPADHLLLDLFWMPVVEPYAISDRFSTAGKINMNYQIAPFTYLNRPTGLRALLTSEMITAMPNGQVSVYKVPGGGTKTALRTPIDADATLAQFASRFSAGDIFHSASEICTMEIVPKTTPAQTAASMPSFWAKNILTGDNVRERIYTVLYPRLTTKSNTFTVHFQVQALKKVPGTNAATWTEGRDVTAGEYRGSAIIERFIDASDPSIPDYAARSGEIATLDTLDKFYKWRVVANRKFTP